MPQFIPSFSHQLVPSLGKQDHVAENQRDNLSYIAKRVRIVVVV